MTIIKRRCVGTPRVRHIPIGHGLFGLVDNEDYAEAMRFKWHRTPAGYIQRNVWKRGQNTNGGQYLHRLVAILAGWTIDGLEIDHANGQPFDCTRANLRIASRSENACNTSVRAASRSGIKGVCWDSDRQKWYARINFNRQCVWQGRFDILEEAAAARATVLPNFHGDFARCS
jgi:hypothetical protein